MGGNDPDVHGLLFLFSFFEETWFYGSICIRSRLISPPTFVNATRHFLYLFTEISPSFLLAFLVCLCFFFVRVCWSRRHCDSVVFFSRPHLFRCPLPHCPPAQAGKYRFDFFFLVEVWIPSFSLLSVFRLFFFLATIWC